MTLYERRSSMESWDRDRWRDQSPTGSQRRKLSFNPVGTWVPPNVQEEPVAAFEVSRAKRIAQVAVAVVYCLLAAGVVFGLNFMFTVAAVSTNVCALPVGTILDRYGPRIAGIIGCFFLFVGALLFAFAFDLRNHFDAYIPGYLFLALGFFLVYLIVPAFILLAQVFLMPAQSYKTVGELVRRAEDPLTDDDASAISDEDRRQAVLAARRQHRDSIVEQTEALLGSKSGEAQAAQEEQKQKQSGVWGALHGRSAMQQIATPWFVLITLFTVVQMTRINYFVATIRTQYAELLHSYPAAVRVNDFFDVALPLGGVVAVPFIGLVLDHTSTVFVLALLVAIATAIGALGCVPAEWAAYANIFFGFATFGKVYGLIICLAGLCNFSQAGLDALTHRTFGNDPVPVNALLLGTAAVVGVALVGYVWRQSRGMERERLETEAEAAREVLIPGADEEEVERPHGHQTYGTA
ncbi:hypothetical protein H2203_006783 [Taxawa tesnikishii (nom. ined.)]|nr:hypothetical protein H2203_006783 [Dothideales sp. JES 119]